LIICLRAFNSIRFQSIEQTTHYRNAHRTTSKMFNKFHIRYATLIFIVIRNVLLMFCIHRQRASGVREAIKVIKNIRRAENRRCLEGQLRCSTYLYSMHVNSFFNPFAVTSSKICIFMSKRQLFFPTLALLIPLICAVFMNEIELIWWC